MTSEDLKPNKILRGPLFPEPVQVFIATLDWQPIVKVEHYRLRQDSIKHPVELKEDPTLYRTGGRQ